MVIVLGTGPARDGALRKRFRSEVRKPRHKAAVDRGALPFLSPDDRGLAAARKAGDNGAVGARDEVRFPADNLDLAVAAVQADTVDLLAEGQVLFEEVN